MWDDCIRHLKCKSAKCFSCASLGGFAEAAFSTLLCFKFSAAATYQVQEKKMLSKSYNQSTPYPGSPHKHQTTRGMKGIVQCKCT